MFKVQTLNAIAAIGLNQFPREIYEISSEIQHPDAILVRSQNMHDMTFSDSIKVVGRAGVGVNTIPVAKLTQAGIPVLNTVGANANAVRELVLAGMLLASRNICQAWDYVRQLQCDEQDLDQLIEQNKKHFVGSELLGKTLGIVGLGSIGVKVANAAMDLGMHVIGYDPTITVSRAWELSSGVQQAHTLNHLLKEVDFISFHVPLTEATKNMIDASRLKMMKNTAILLNFARDGIIDNAALLDALNAKTISGYVTDFPHNPLKNHPRVISLPHLGASTVEAEENCAIMIGKQVREFLENGNIINSVNFPTIEMPRHEEGVRIAIVNANVPNIVAQISSKLGSAGLNILSLSNASRDEIAYTLIDVNQGVTEKLLKEIATIQGIIRVRKV
jgi:D-3-phosphoglycerate dehydrogenase